MTTPDPGRKTRIVKVRDRNIVIRQLVDAQMMLMAREARVLQRDDMSTDRKIDGVDRMFRILQSAVVQPEDREFLDELIIIGDLDIKELMSFITVFNELDEDDKPRVRRGRPPVKRS
jgi:hypothetical protein